MVFGPVSLWRCGARLSANGVPERPEEEITIEDIGFIIDNTTKTRAIFEINKE